MLFRSESGEAYAAGAQAERNKVAQWMIQRSYATGHGDTVEDLLKELEWQVAEAEREACLKAMEATKFTRFVQPSYGNIRQSDLAQMYEAPYTHCVIAIKNRNKT